MTDTGRTRRSARLTTLASLLIVVAFTAIGCAHSGGAVRPSGLQVVWVRDATVYVAGRDSIRLETGTPVVIRDADRRLASGHVERIVDGTLAVVSLTSGTLRGVKKWNDLSVMTEAPTFVAPPLLRVGFPATGRGSFVTDCARRPLPPYGLETSFRTDVISDRSWRGVSVPSTDPRNSTGHSAPWPDTLLVRLFDDPADEEIALQRGEIDAAVFLPGGASRYIREQWRPGTTTYGALRGWRPNVNITLAARPSRADSLRLFGCPIVTTAAWAPYLNALGPDSLVNLLRCEPKTAP